MDAYATDIKRLFVREMPKYPSHLPYAVAQYIHDTVEKKLDEEREAVKVIFSIFQKHDCDHANECRRYVEAALTARANLGK